MSMFREKALAKMQSPEQLDEPLKALNRKGRLAAFTVLIVLASAVGWALFARLPESGRGNAVLVTTGSVRPIQAQGGGKIRQWQVNVGDEVTRGQLLAIVDQPTIERELEEARGRLDELTVRNEELQRLRRREFTLELQLLDVRRQRLTGRIEQIKDYITKARDFAENKRSQHMKVLARQRGNLVKSKRATKVQAGALKRSLASVRRLEKEKLTSADTVRQAERSYQDAKMKLSELDLRLVQAKTSQLRVKDTFQRTAAQMTRRENELAELELQLRELVSRKISLTKENQESVHRERGEIEDLRRTIEQHDARLQRELEIRSDFTGRIVELSVTRGQVVRSGQRVAQIDIREQTDPLVALAYFTAKDGKKLSPNDRVRISPTTANQKKYGSIVGTVTSVSAYPVSQEAVVDAVGNSVVAQELLREGHTIQVEIALRTSDRTVSGYEWTSSGGAPIALTAGTKASVSVTVERRAPITYVVPKLRKWGGL